MRFSTHLVVLVIGLLWLQAAPVAQANSEPTSTGTTQLAQIDIDPSKNPLGLNGAMVANSTGSINALTYLSGADDPATVAIRIINLALSFLGAISLIFMLYAGFVWFTARDNEEEAKRAKQILAGSVIGLTITLGSYGIAYLVFLLASTAAGGTVTS